MLEILFYFPIWPVTVRNGAPDVVAAAIEATTQLLAKGNSSELKKIFEANVFPVALKLFEQRSQREHALKLLHAIILHLSYEIINDDNLAIEMLNLFEWVNYFLLPIPHWAILPVTSILASPMRFIKRGQVIQESTWVLLYLNYSLFFLIKSKTRQSCLFSVR